MTLDILAVVKGLTILAGKLSSASLNSNYAQLFNKVPKLVDALAMDISLLMEGDKLERIIPRHTRLPFAPKKVQGLAFPSALTNELELTVIGVINPPPNRTPP